MNTLIVTFSLQQDSQSLAVAKHIQSKIDPKINAKILNLHEVALPMWGTIQDIWPKIKSQLELADGYIFVIPEYCGSPSPSYFNFCLFLNNEVSHKPALLVSVSSGRGGSYPILGARAFGYKNSKINYIPEHLIIRDVEKQEYKIGFMNQKIDYVLGVFQIYKQNFVPIRNQIILDERFKNGM